MKLSNKAAMFGLDARIALAIFGALSVISGAALYGAIQNSKATALLTDLNELGKAWESHYIDNGTDLIKQGSTGNELHIADLTGLTTGSAPLWQGPYTSMSLTGKNLTKNGQNDIYYILFAKDTAWASSEDWVDHLCDSSNPCYAWIHVKGISGKLSKTLDQMIDNADGVDSGNYRTREKADVYGERHFFKYAVVNFN